MVSVSAEEFELEGVLIIIASGAERSERKTHITTTLMVNRVSDVGPRDWETLEISQAVRY